METGSDNIMQRFECLNQGISYTRVNVGQQPRGHGWMEYGELGHGQQSFEDKIVIKLSSKKVGQESTAVKVRRQ